jgi:hypothetical protein
VTIAELMMDPKELLFKENLDEENVRKGINLHRPQRASYLVLT